MDVLRARVAVLAGLAWLCAALGAVGQTVTFGCYPKNAQVGYEGGARTYILLGATGKPIDLTGRYDGKNLLRLVVGENLDGQGSSNRKLWRKTYVLGDLRDGDSVSVYLPPLRKWEMIL